jgi:DNA-binding protein HU-beta
MKVYLAMPLEAEVTKSFFTDEVKKKLERVSVNPITQQRLLIPPKLILSFKPSAGLRERFK